MSTVEEAEEAVEKFNRYVSLWCFCYRFKRVCLGLKLGLRNLRRLI